MATPAERQRRHRRHVAGDHTLCEPSRCNGHAVTSRVTAAECDEESQIGDFLVAARFGLRGQRLWDELNDGRRSPGEVVLIEEACRIADRLDKLHALLSGDRDVWMTLRSSEDGSKVTVMVDGALSQARMHATTLRGIVTELRQSAASGTGKPSVVQEGSVLDQLAARRKARLTDASGQ